MKRKQISRAEESQIVHIDSPFSRMWSITSHSVSLGYAQWFPSEEDKMARGREKSHFTVEKPDNYSFIQEVKVNINGDKSCV